MSDDNSEYSSNEEEEEHEVKNVSRLVMKPSGYVGQTKKGHLIFDASFETGNLGRVDYISDFEYDLFIRPDICNSRHRVWFNFTVENPFAGQKVVFNIVNFSKYLPLYLTGFSPVVRSSQRSKFQRIPSKQVFYYHSPHHGERYVMSFTFVFDKDDDVYQFAFCFPYSYSRLQKYLELIEQKNLPYLKREQLGKSANDRNVDLITITSDEKGFKKKVVMVTGRVHPGETPSSFICQGIIDFLLSQHQTAKLLRNYTIFKIIPMLNPDGVFLGNYRTSLFGFDLNRCWEHPLPYQHPTLHATKALLQELSENQEEPVDICLDLHAHTGLIGACLYGNTYDNPNRFERHMLYPKLVSQVAEDFVYENNIYNRDPGKAGTSRRFFCSFFQDKANCYTVEVSFYGRHNNTGGTQSVMTYSEQDYMQIGEKLLQALLEYFCVTGHILLTAIPRGVIGPTTRQEAMRIGRDKNGASTSDKSSGQRMSGVKMQVDGAKCTLLTQSTVGNGSQSKIALDEEHSN